MKFKSLNELANEAKAAAQRFPLALAFAVIGALAAIKYTNFSYQEHEYLGGLVNLMMVSALGITSFLSLRVFAETHQWPKRQQLLANLSGVIILAVYYYILPKELKYFDLNRYGLINANLHLLVAIAPFLFLSQCTNAFWQYNKGLFIRFIIAFIYSNTIYIGIAIALGVTDQLFEFIKFNGRIYSQLWILTVGVFNTWFFLKGVPANILNLERDDSYPKGLRVFTQFVLIPLVILYLFILYMYMGKIIGSWTLPRGWLSSFILGVSILGIVTLLLVHPLKSSKEFSWIRGYSRYFYLALFPLIIMMVIAIGRRIVDYGITEQRYFVLVFALWLLVLALRFSFRPNTDIRSIPLTLFVLVALATWGPWSAMSVSKWNQTSRLEKLLTENGLLKDGRIQKTEKTIEYKTSHEISNIVAYLESSFGLKYLKKWAPLGETVFGDDITAKDFVSRFLGLEYTGYYYQNFYRGHSLEESSYYSMHRKPEAVSNISGYDYYAQFNLYSLNASGYQPPEPLFSTNEGPIRVFFDRSTDQIKASYKEEIIVLATLSSHWLKEMRDKHGMNGYNIETEQLTFKSEGSQFKCKVEITSLSGQLSSDNKQTKEISNINGNLLFSFK